MVETSTKVPSTLTLIILSFLLSFFMPEILKVSQDEFDEILYLMLPIILLPDILNISTNELRKHYKEIVYLAFIAVIISIVIAIFITPLLLSEYQLTIGMLIALFSMLMATDAITVASIMSKFKLPEKLKIYAESESLFNDVTALIIYYFIALPMINGGELNILSINTTLFKVLFLSISIGVVVSFVGYFFIKILKNSFDQFLVIYLIVIISFMLAEHFHIAGILSIVTSVLVFKYLVQKELSKKQTINQNEDIESTIMELIKNVPALTKRDFREYKKEAEFIGIFANAIVFTIVASLIDLEILLTYFKEIIIVFILTTIIRFFVVSIMIKKLKLPFRWSMALTLSGAKGALAIIMVHSLPYNFLYSEMFEAIIIGNVLLTTFIYTFSLMFHIKNNQSDYKNDMENKPNKNKTINLISLLEKDTLTGAYTKTFIDEIIEKELSRAQRYKTEFSCILIDLGLQEETNARLFAKIIQNKIRVNDYFGKFNDNKFIILTVNTSLSGAMILAEKLKVLFKKNHIKNNERTLSFGITEYTDTDNYDSLIEKLEDALHRAKEKHSAHIEIQV